MPELPEVETICQKLAPLIRGNHICEVILRRQTLRDPLPSQMEQKLMGKKIKSIDRRGKYLLIEVPPWTWLVHLGMSGNFYWSAQAPIAKHAHVGVGLKKGGYLIYHDPRRFGRMTLTQDPSHLHPWLKNLGIEPLSKDFTGKYFYQCLKGRRASIKSTLMNAQIVTGIGNIYASESLYAAKIHPQSKASELSIQAVTRLVKCVRVILRKAILAGGSTIRDFMSEEGKPGHFQMQWAVYGQKSCQVCKTVILQIVQNGRSSYFCPHCQK